VNHLAGAGAPPIEVSIVIVSFNAAADLERCLNAIGGHPPQAAYEVIVVDNDSRDGSAAAARRLGATVIENRANVGFARATNIGIRASRGANLLLLNSDTIVPAGAIDRLLELLASRPDVAVLGPRLIDENGRAELSFGRMIGPIAEWRQKRLVTGQAHGHPRMAAKVEAMTRQQRIVDWVSGACLLVRRDDAESVGLLDERYFLYTEDVDFCAAIRGRGRRVLFTPEVEIMHRRGGSKAAAPAAAQSAYVRSRIAFYEKHHPFWAIVLRLYLRLRGTRRYRSV
jgi:N-acetylglucosaminyl-diphospho-decaprenol L-rhamnosyltransferase